MLGISVAQPTVSSLARMPASLEPKMDFGDRTSMFELESYVLFIVLVAIQMLGLASAAVARISIGSRHQGKFQWMFMTCLGLVGMGMVISLGVAPGLWIGSGASLAVMVLAATCEFGRSRRATAW